MTTTDLTTAAAEILAKRAWSAQAAAAIWTVISEIAALADPALYTQPMALADQLGQLEERAATHTRSADAAQAAMHAIETDDDWDGSYTTLAALERSRDEHRIAANLLRQIIAAL